MPKRPDNWKHWTRYVPLPILWCLCFCLLPAHFGEQIVVAMRNAYRSWHSDLGEIWREIRGKVDIEIK